MSVAPLPPSPPTPRARPQAVAPPLENGDRLTRHEFERRYASMPHVKKAELIEGIVYMACAVRLTRHGRPHAQLIAWLTYYAGKTGIPDYGDNSTVRLDEDNEPQPDLLMLLPAVAGGTARLDDDGYVTGPPDLACEVASSSVSLDTHAKLNAYRRNGVREYLVWRVDDRAIDWYALREGLYQPLPATPDGILKSELFPGLWLNTPALLASDLPQVWATIDQGLVTPEHAAFAKKLRPN